MSVLERQALASHAGEPDRHDDVGALLLDAHDHALAPARVAHASADRERQVLLAHGRRGGVSDGVADHLRWGLRPYVERQALVLWHLAQEPRRLAHAVAVDAPVQRVR